MMPTVHSDLRHIVQEICSRDFQPIRPPSRTITFRSTTRAADVAVHTECVSGLRAPPGISQSYCAVLYALYSTVQCTVLRSVLCAVWSAAHTDCIVSHKSRHEFQNVLPRCCCHVGPCSQISLERPSFARGPVWRRGTAIQQQYNIAILCPCFFCSTMHLIFCLCCCLSDGQTQYIHTVLYILLY